MKKEDHLQEIRRQVDMFFDHALSLDDEIVSQKYFFDGDLPFFQLLM